MYLKDGQAANEEGVVGRDAEGVLVHCLPQVSAERGEAHIGHSVLQRLGENICERRHHL